MVRHYKSISKQSKVTEGIIKQIRDEIRGGKSIRQASKDHGLSESSSIHSQKESKEVRATGRGDEARARGGPGGEAGDIATST